MVSRHIEFFFFFYQFLYKSHDFLTLFLEIERSKYDSYDMNGGPGFNPSEFGGEFGADDFFEFFNDTSSRHGFGGFNYENQSESTRPSRKKGGKTEDGIVKFPISLEELYKGKVVKFTSHRNKLCSYCNG